jgi:hypothetical protein
VDANYTFLIIAIPLIIMNIFIAKRKGQDRLVFGLLSLLPIVNFFCIIYLLSLTDIDILNKLDKIIEYIEKQD